MHPLSAIPTHSPEAVARIIKSCAANAFPGECAGSPAQHPCAFIDVLFADIEALFAGNFPGRQASDTGYHDLEHTLQATLCFVRLITHYVIAKNEGAQGMLTIRFDDFRLGLFAIALHDVGYLKEEGDTQGTGAKYTTGHEMRSCEFVQSYLPSKFGVTGPNLIAVQHMICCTGPFANIETVMFHRPEYHLLGQALRTADYVGQISDPRYIEKLPGLYSEFEESDDYRRVPEERRAFTSVEKLLEKTPMFWAHHVLPLLYDECGGLVDYLREPYPEGGNPYLEGIRENLNTVDAKVNKA